MAIISSRVVQQHLQRSARATTTTGKGRAFEDLICYVFGKISGISVSRRNQLNTFQTEEIDIAFWNEQRPQGLFFLPNIILVECKNWSNAVGSAEVAWFDRKIQDRGLDFGILVAVNGITGVAQDRTAAHAIVSGALSQRRRLIVIDQAEIVQLVKSGDLVRLVKTKLCDLAAAGTAI